MLRQQKPQTEHPTQNCYWILIGWKSRYFLYFGSATGLKIHLIGEISNTLKFIMTKARGFNVGAVFLID